MEEKKRKRLSPLLIFFFILIGVTLVLCCTVLALWFHGRSSLTQTAPAPELPAASSETIQADPESDVIVYNGKRYRYNQDMCNILLMGIDSHQTPDHSAGSHDQADVIVLAALDLSSGRMNLISISRDAMCDMEVPGEGGSSQLLHTQLALSYAYGDGQHTSCQITRDAVSNLFFGLPIQGYAAYYMSGISALNDAVGGVTVTVLDDYPFTDLPGCGNMSAGSSVTLNGKQAEYYIRARLGNVDSNQKRMQRQKQYILALLSQAKEQVAGNPASIMSLYGAVEDYVITDLDLSRISYLATKAVSLRFSGDIRSLEGEIALGDDGFSEFTVDQSALYQLMLEVFYTEVPASVSQSE